MKGFYIYLILCLSFLGTRAQSIDEITNEMERIFMENNIKAATAYGWKLKNIDIRFSAPFVIINEICENLSMGFRDEYIVKFDVLKAYYDNRYYGGSKSLVISCSSGFEVEERRTHLVTNYNSHESTYTDKKTTDYYAWAINSDIIISRLINGFKNLEALALESNAKSPSHIFDNASLNVQNISFVGPEETGKLKANQTGCIKVEIKNTSNSNALNVSCVIEEKSKSELFSFQQYTSLPKIASNEISIINIPIKASEDIDNSAYQFDIKVLYNGITIKNETLNINTYNQNKRTETVSVSSGNSRIKTIRMRKMPGNTYLVSCKVNDFPIDFIFDTGATSVTLSRKQANFMLKNGYLSYDDIVGFNSYQTASGDIKTGTVIKLRKIEISGLIINNVEATIINSDSAPLLLGQSALSRLGKIQIDYNNSTLSIIR